MIEEVIRTLIKQKEASLNQLELLEECSFGDRKKEITKIISMEKQGIKELKEELKQ